MMRGRSWLVTSIAVVCGGVCGVVCAGVCAGVPLSAQDPVAPAPSEYGRAPKLDVQTFESADRQVRFEYPRKDWQIVPRSGAAVIPGATSPILSLVQRKREAAVVVEQTKLHQPLTLDDITDLFSQLEIDAIRERQPLATDVQSKLVDVGGRRIVILTYARQGVAGPERIRQYSIPAGADLFRFTCVAAASYFARYEPVFAHVAASFTVTGGATQ